jgi:hypothetical protein
MNIYVTLDLATRMDMCRLQSLDLNYIHIQDDIHAIYLEKIIIRLI